VPSFGSIPPLVYSKVSSISVERYHWYEIILLAQLALIVTASVGRGS